MILNDAMRREISRLARENRVSRREIVNTIMQTGIQQKMRMRAMNAKWNSNPKKSQQVAALTCQGLSKEEIARQMCVAAAIVKAHLEFVFQVFGVQNRDQLTIMLRYWDFSKWDV